MKQSIYRFKDGGRREYAEFYAKESARLYGDWIKRKDIQAIIPIPIQNRINPASCFDVLLHIKNPLLYPTILRGIL